MKNNRYLHGYTCAPWKAGIFRPNRRLWQNHPPEKLELRLED